MADCTYPSPFVLTARKLYLNAQIKGANSDSEREKLRREIRESWTELTAEAVKMFAEQAKQIAEQAQLANWLESIDLGGWPTVDEIRVQMRSDDQKARADILQKDAEIAAKSIKIEAPKAEIKVVEKLAKVEPERVQCTIVSKPAVATKPHGPELFVPSFNSLRQQLKRKVCSEDLKQFARMRHEIPRNERWFRYDRAFEVLKREEREEATRKVEATKRQLAEANAKLARTKRRAGSNVAMRLYQDACQMVQHAAKAVERANRKLQQIG